MVHLDMRPQVAGATAELGLTAAGAAIGVLEEARRDHLRQVETIPNRTRLAPVVSVAWLAIAKTELSLLVGSSS